MPGGKGKSSSQEIKARAEVKKARTEARTTRTGVRWVSMGRVFEHLGPVIRSAITSGTTVFVTLQAKDSINAILVGWFGAVFLIVVTAGALKIWWDGREKKRLRAGRTTIEEENQRLRLRVAGLEGAMLSHDMMLPPDVTEGG